MSHDSWAKLVTKVRFDLTDGTYRELDGTEAARWADIVDRLSVFGAQLDWSVDPFDWREDQIKVKSLPRKKKTKSK